MTEIQQNRWDQLVRRSANIVGGGSQVGDTLNELFPTIDVENVPGELLLLAGTRICIGSSTLTGAALERPRIQLFNPAESGVIIAVSSFIVDADTQATIRYSTNETALTSGIATQRFRDRRLALISLPTGAIRQESLVAIVDADGQFTVIANEAVLVTDPNSIAVLPPGSGFEVGSASIASNIHVTFNWRERSAEQAELNFP